MSRLLIDIGNTRLKWARLETDAPIGTVQALAHDGDPAETLKAMQVEWQRASIDAVWVAQVFGPAQEPALQAALVSLAVPIHLIRSPASASGWRSAYVAPERLGVDRFLAMLGVWVERRAAFCIASAGTALTFDAVDERGQHAGGVIAPGLSTMVQATLGSTRFATENISRQYDDGLGQDTESAVRQGALHAAAGLLDRLGARHLRRILAGGDAETLKPLLRDDWILAPDAVLHGLAAYAAAQGQ